MLGRGRRRPLHRPRHDGLLLDDRGEGVVRNGRRGARDRPGHDRGEDLRAAPLPARARRRRSRASIAGRGGSLSCARSRSSSTASRSSASRRPTRACAIHSLLGTFFYGVFVARCWSSATTRCPAGRCPTAGLTLASMLLAAVADVEPLVLHDGQVRLLMGRGWRPILARRRRRRGDVRPRQGHGVRAVARRRRSTLTGDATSGKTVFAENCSGCHGDGGQGGGVGPTLAGSGLDAATVSAVVQQGRGVMPPAIVAGQEQADVVAYVVSIATPSQ